MAANVAGIDPYQDSFTVGIVDGNGIEICVEAFTNTSCGSSQRSSCCVRIMLNRFGVEGSASWGSHVSVAIAAAGFDAREVAPQRSAA